MKGKDDAIKDKGFVIPRLQHYRLKLLIKQYNIL